MNRDFSKRNRARCEAPNGFNHRLSDWTASDWMVAILGELCEAANIQEKLNRIRDGIPGNKETEEQLRFKLANELADAYIYLDLFCQSQDINLSDAVDRVFVAKSHEIGYEEAQS